MTANGELFPDLARVPEEDWPAPVFGRAPPEEPVFGRAPPDASDAGAAAVPQRIARHDPVDLVLMVVEVHG